MRIGPYRTWLFDCDGVILDSNRVKSDAFHAIALPFGEDVAARFVAYHMDNGGISRGVKIRYLFEEILGRTACDDDVVRGVARFAEFVREGLRSCALVPGVAEFLPDLPKQAFRAVVSGGAQTELHQIFGERGLAQHFDAIRGSPDTKDQILSGFGASTLQMPAVYFGDSRLDYEVATRFGADFVFVSGCTEFSGWETFFAGLPVRVISDFVGVTVVGCEQDVAQG